MRNSIANSIDQEFIDAADRLVQGEPLGYAVNLGPVTTKTKHWGIFTDKINKDCLFVLTRWLDGTGVFFRYPKYLVVVNH